MSSTKTFIILVTFNGEHYLPRFLSSLTEHTTRDAYELIVVDNASSDATVEIIRKQAPTAVLLLQKTNRGFAAGCNVGISHALQQHAAEVFLANQDLVFAEGWLAPLKETLLNPKVAAVQPMILLYPATQKLNSYGNALHFLGFGYARGYGVRADEWRCKPIEEVAYCSFAAVLLSCTALAKVGLLDEDFFMYHEDSDLCWRLRLAGFLCQVNGSAHVFHQYEFSRSISKFYYIERNRLLIILKNYRIKTLLLIAPIFLFWEVGMCAYSLTQLVIARKTLGLAEKLRGYAYFFSRAHLRKLMLSRAAVQHTRILTDREIVELCTPRIEFQDVESPLLSLANKITEGYWYIIKRLI